MKDNKPNPHHYAVIVAGGSGTRLWPMSRKDIPKQMQPLVSGKPLIEDTADRLLEAFEADHIFISTTVNYADQIKKILPMIPADNIIVEPVAKGPALAFALFAEVILRRDPMAVIVSLASDHAITNTEQFKEALANARNYVSENTSSIALIGIVPNRPDTGLGYIKVDSQIQDEPTVFSVEKFVEKPTRAVAEQYVASGEYFWNVAYYCFSAATLVEAYKEASPDSMKRVIDYVDTNDESFFNNARPMVHEIEVINAARFPLVMIPAKFAWSDIGNWETLHDLLANNDDNPSRVVTTAKHHIDIDSEGCMIKASDDQKLIATVGLKDIVIVDTADSLLVLHKDRTQDIKAVIEELKKRGLNQYL